MKPNGFSFTMNAVLSTDKAESATPISFLLRDVLTHTRSYSEAKRELETRKIASDCLILLSSKEPSELFVIERTPTRFATRYSEDGFIAVTNDYKKLENETKDHSLSIDNQLTSTSCGRYRSVEAEYKNSKPETTKKCLDILSSKNIMMGITVQQMVFENTRNLLSLHMP